MSHLHVEAISHVCHIRLSRPEKKNALTNAMYEGLCTELEKASLNPNCHVVLLSGENGVFTAGNDISDFMQNPPTGETSAVFRLLKMLVNFEKPLMAAVEGPAVGIGTTLLLHCDFIVAANDAKFQMPFVRLGLVPEGGSSYLLPKAVGLAKASEWLLFGNVFSGEEAFHAGLVNKVVSSPLVFETALNAATELSSRPPEAVKLAKKLIRSHLISKTEKTISQEGQIFVERLASQEAQEAFMSFMMKKA